MIYTEYYKGFLTEIRQDFTFPRPHNWIYGVRIDFDAWLGRGQTGVDFDTAQRSARYAVMAYVALERIPEPRFKIGQTLNLPSNQGEKKYTIRHSTWHRVEMSWYYKEGQSFLGEGWKPEAELKLALKDIS